MTIVEIVAAALVLFGFLTSCSLVVVTAVACKKWRHRAIKAETETLMLREENRTLIELTDRRRPRMTFEHQT